jgi:hypothetical protein
LTQNLVLIKRVIGFVPRPQHLFASTAMFALLLASALFAVRLLSPVIVAAIAGIVFCLYVYCKVWGATVATPAAP